MQGIYNFRQVSERVLTSGQPSADQIEAAAKEGVQVVINLATFSPDHSLPDEAVIVQSMGMDYYWIPVEWGRPQRDDFEQFEALMQRLGDVKVLVHCQANFRATAFYSLYALKHLGWSELQAEQLRSTIWQVSDYPVWEQFIREMTIIGSARGSRDS